ncbi:MAG: VOC family protein [Roseivirga sp.]
MTTINIYLTFNGNCAEAFDFYKSVFGGEYPHVSKFSEMPPQEGMPPLSEADQNKIMHMSLPISKETILMGSDTAGPWAADYKVGNNFSISVDTDTKEEADRLMAALSVDGQVTMPMENSFWGSYFGMLTDKFGISWMISVVMEQH